MTTQNAKPHAAPDADKDKVFQELFGPPRTPQQIFTENLEKRMKAKGFTQSTLAREIWGSMKDKRGYDVARNRDRISSYLAGSGLPEPENLKKLADAVGCEPEDLMPGAGERPLTRAKAKAEDNGLTPVPNMPGYWRVRIDVVKPANEAIEIFRMAHGGGVTAPPSPVVDRSEKYRELFGEDPPPEPAPRSAKKS